MTREEIKNTPEIVDFMLDKSFIADSRMRLHKRLEEICELAIKTLDDEDKWKSGYEQMYQEKMHKLNKRKKKELEHQLNISVQNNIRQTESECKDCYYNDGEVHAECVICNKTESEG